jgi:hypothetical protein
VIEVPNPFFATLRIGFLVTLPLLSFVCGAVLAEGLAPPSENLHRVTNNIIVAVVLGIDAPGSDVNGSFSVATQSDLFGRDSAPAKLSLRAPSWVLAQLSAGSRYVIAYSSYTSNPMLSESVVLDPKGPRVLMDPGMEPAIYIDSASTREMLAHAPSERDVESRAYLAQVLAGLASHDPQIQSYFAAELAYQSELPEKLRSSDVLLVKQLLDNSDAHPSARAHLLDMAANSQAGFDDVWLENYASHLLGSLAISGHMVVGNLSAALAQSAFTAVEKRKLVIALPKLTRWIASDAPGLAEFALLAIRRQAPLQEEAMVRQTLERSLLNNATRAFLVDHLRRLKIMRAALGS